MMNTKETIKRTVPYALAAGIASAGLYIWQKTRIGLPEGAIPISGFQVDRYLGQWYEIARFDYRFEKGLKNVTAYYSKNVDGSIQVINKGQNITTGKWGESTGKAKFIDDQNTARLKVSFFGPFYAAYTVVAIDHNYENALVVGNDLEYLWLLSREPVMPKQTETDFLQKATALGYDVSKLIWTEQDNADMIPIATVS